MHAIIKTLSDLPAVLLCFLEKRILSVFIVSNTARVGDTQCKHRANEYQTAGLVDVKAHGD